MSKFAIEINKLSFSYAKKDTILKNISFSLEPGGVLTILGPNGSGKTTLLNCILKNVTTYDGNITLFGKDLTQYSSKEFASKVAYVPQLSQLNFDYTVEEFVLMGCNPHKQFFAQPTSEDYRIVEQNLRRLDLFDKKNNIMRQISGGERQLAYIARALTQEPQMIIMDEPTSALDYSNQYKVIKILKSLSGQGYTVVLTSHNPEYAYMLDGHVAMLYKGAKFLYGTVEEMMTEYNLSDMYKTKIKVKYVPEYDMHMCIRID